MTEQRVWVTGYQVSGRRDILLAQHPFYDGTVMFSFDAHGIAYPVNEEALQSYRASGAVPTFYAIPNPF